MTHKERALAAFKGSALDRFPAWYGAAPEFTEKLVAYVNAKDENEALYDIIGIDFKTIRPKYVGPPLAAYENGEIDTEWGIRRGGIHYGQPLNHPLAGLTDIAQIKKHYRFPDPGNYDVSIAPGEREWAKDFCLIGGMWSPFFHDSTELVGMEEFFIDMFDSPEVVDYVIEGCFEFYCELDRRAFEQNKGVIDMYFIGNDFGSQRALLISPDMWRKFYKPRVKRLMAQAKANGCVTAIHSCGSIKEIIPDLLEIGVDAINPIQVNADDMDPKMLMREFGNDVVFFGGIDENHILLECTEAEVREETRRMIDILGAKGRYITAPSHDYLLPEVPENNIFAMYDEAKKYLLGG